jgi:DNA topoisomerase I
VLPASPARGGQASRLTAHRLPPTSWNEAEHICDGGGLDSRVQQTWLISLRAKHSSRQPAQAAETAKAAGLYYVNDGEPGLTRVGHAKTLRLRGVDGAVVRDIRIRERVRWLAIPPAWTNVWICPTPRGHIQAMGRDQRGLRQYIYHPAWRALRDRAKFDRLVAFAQALARIRARVARDLAKRTLCRERVLALVVHLLDTTHVRVGNEEYARNNGSFGLTTLRDRHARITGSSLLFEFRAKSGKVQRLRLSGRKLALMVKACQDLPGQRLSVPRQRGPEAHHIERCKRLFTGNLRR